MAIVIRPAKVEDLGQIQSIFEYYVLNTVVSFIVLPPPSDYVRVRYNASIERNLPYLVAIQTSSDGSELVVGYSYASPFRGYMLAYGHTVEISIFCHPEHKNRGIGGKMMAELLNRLKNTSHRTMEAGHEDKPVEVPVRKVMAIMSIDETAEDKGLALRDWYIKWGFEVVGHLKGVGNKNGRDIDTMYMERSL